MDVATSHASAVWTGLVIGLAVAVPIGFLVGTIGGGGIQIVDILLARLW